MANLNDILEGLVLTDNKVINKLLATIEDLDSDVENINSTLDVLETELDVLEAGFNSKLDISENTLRNEMQNSINGIQQNITNNITILEDKIKRGSGTYAIVDKDTPDKGGLGTLVSDILSSNGECYSIKTSTSTNYCLYSGVFADVKYGHYALCARVRIGSTTSASELVQTKILNGTKEIAVTNFAGSVFSSSSQYYYLYSTFKYEGNAGQEKQPLSFQLHTHLVNGINIYFDYAYITMIMPSVFL